MCDPHNRRLIAISVVICSILFICAGVLTVFGICEAYNNSNTYNVTILTATGYLTEQTDCYGLPWRAFIVAEYDVINKNGTYQHYKQLFRRIENNEICGTNEKDAIRNASAVWPLNQQKYSYYLISDPTVLVNMVTHGELYIVFIILLICSIAAVITFVIVYIKARQRRYIRYTQLITA